MKLYMRMSGDQKKDFDEQNCRQVVHTLQYQESMETKCLFVELNAFKKVCGEPAKLKKQVFKRRGPEGAFIEGVYMKY